MVMENIHDVQQALREDHDPDITEAMLAELEKIKTFTANFTDQPSHIVEGKFPVLLFAPGCDQEGENYENIIGDLVSHGYVVFAINNIEERGKSK